MKAILVVGGMGGIGSKIVEKLMPEYKIIVADRTISDENRQDHFRNYSPLILKTF